jgi:cadmium resistance protein CadD (predicted permease)
MIVVAILIAALILLVFVPLMALGLSLIPLALGLAIRAADQSGEAPEQ